MASKKKISIDKMSESEVRKLLKQIQHDVRAGITNESSSDVGDFVISTLEKAGLNVSEFK